MLRRYPLQLRNMTQFTKLTSTAGEPLRIFMSRSGEGVYDFWKMEFMFSITQTRKSSLTGIFCCSQQSSSFLSTPCPWTDFYPLQMPSAHHVPPAGAGGVQANMPFMKHFPPNIWKEWPGSLFQGLFCSVVPDRLLTAAVSIAVLLLSHVTCAPLLIELQLYVTLGFVYVCVHLTDWRIETTKRRVFVLV